MKLNGLQIPENWSLEKISDVAVVYNGNSINAQLKKEKFTGLAEGYNYIGTKDVNVNGTINYENGVKIPYEEKKFKVAPVGSVFVCAEGGSAGKKTAYVKESVCFGNKLFAIIPDVNLVQGKFIFYYTRESSFFEQFTNLSNGIIGGVGSKKFQDIQIPLPPIQEQQRIVNRIEELFSELDKAEETLLKAKEQLEVYRQAVLSTEFENVSLINITSAFDITGGLTKNSKRKELKFKRPYLRVANVYYNRLDLTDIQEIGISATEEARTLLQKDDLLFVEGNGSKDQIGRVAVWDGSIANCLHQNHIIKGRGNGKILPIYAMYYLISREGRKQILDIASSTSGLYTLSINKIKRLNIPECTLEEQISSIERIENKLSVCREIEQTITKALLQSQSLRKAILKEAFTGKLV